MKNFISSLCAVGCMVLLLVIIHGPLKAQSSAPSLILKTEGHHGYGPFRVGATIIVPRGDRAHPLDAVKPNLQGIPDSLSDLLVSSEILSFQQLTLQAFRSGKLDTTTYRRFTERSSQDTSALAPIPLYQFVSVAAGFNQAGEVVFVLDQNGNADFSDDSLRVLPQYASMREQKAEVEANLLPVRYEVWRDGSVQKDSVWVMLSRSEMMPERFKLVMFFGVPAYRTTSLNWEGTRYSLVISKSISGIDYGYPSLHLLDEAGDIVPDSYCKPGEYLILPDAYLRFESMSLDGSQLTLVPDPSVAETGGSQVGLKALPISAKTIEDEPISLVDYAGKYVLLDFWGSWCGPCIEELPYQKRAYELFHDRGFEALGVAMDDSTALMKYLAENPTPWKQILQKAQGDKPIIDLYHISGYPTTFIIGPDGKIIAKGLRGEALYARLCQWLGTGETQRKALMEGKQSIQLTGHESAVKIEILLKQGTEFDQMPLFPWEGKWQRGLDLAPGRYLYQFSVDGDRIADPNNPKHEVVDGANWSVMQVDD